MDHITRTGLGFNVRDFAKRSIKSTRFTLDNVNVSSQIIKMNQGNSVRNFGRRFLRNFEIKPRIRNKH
jgi:hypothetical protein